MVGNGETEFDERSRESLSETPTYHRPSYPAVNPYGDVPYEHFDEDADDDESEAGRSNIMDRDGDTEMSASPGLSRSSRSVSVSANPYGYDPELDTDDRSSQDGSISTNYDYDEEAALMRAAGYGGRDVMGEDLGVANQVHEVDDESSDSSIRGPTRRVPRYQRGNARVQQYDPRISMMFAEHQQSMRGSQENPIGVDLDELEEVRRVVEPTSRHRRMTAYRVMPPRRVDPLRSSRSPSATRVISSSSSRPSRPPRQYVRSHS